MAIFLLACKEMVTRMKKLLIWMVPLHFEFFRLVLLMVMFQLEYNGEYKYLGVSCRLIRFYFITVIQKYAYQSHYSGLYIFSAIF